MLVSLCVIAYNEEDSLPGLLKDISSQTYPHDKTEIILVDSASCDSTRHIMDKFRASGDFKKITVLENPKKSQPAGWNTAIRASSGDVIIRVDAHAHIPCDFIEKNITIINSGENISGGPRPNLIINETPWKRTLLLAESSMFGSSIASYRRNTRRSYVKTMFHAAYKREVFEKAGLFNEGLIRTEDNELHYRMRKAGYRFCFDPSVVSYQYTRSTLFKMLKQKFQNGFWIGITAFVCPACLSVFHFVPFLFILSIFLTSILACLGFYIPALILWGVYLAADIAMSILAVISASPEHKKDITNIFLPFLFPLLHIAYGIGTLIGIINVPFKISHIKISKV